MSTSSIHNLLFLQFLNISIDVEINNCMSGMDSHFFSGSIRVVLLQDDEHRREMMDFAEIIIKHLHALSARKIHLEEKLLNDEASNPARFSCVRSHIVIAWSVRTLHQFLNHNHDTVIPLARDFYKIFLVTATPHWKQLLSRFWLDFGVLHLNFCNRGKRYVYSPFTSSIHSLSSYSIDLKNFNLFPIKITMFIRQPTAIVEMPKLLKFHPSYSHLSDSSKIFITGLDGSILTTMAKHLNFTIDVGNGFGKENFGSVFRNGTISGTLGIVAKGQAHISTNGRFVMNYGTTKIEFTTPFDADKMCAVVPKSNKIPLWLIPFRCFNPLTWILLYFTYCSSTVLWYFVGSSRSLLRVSWEMYSVFRGIPVKINPTITQAFFLAWIMIFNIIILGLVQAFFYNSFTTPYFYKEIDTLDELDRSDLPVATNFYRFDGDGSRLIQSLKTKRIQLVANSFPVIASHKNFSVLQRKRDMEAFIPTHYLAEDGTQLLHLVNECLTSYFISYIVPRGSALLDIFNVVILRLVESGLVKKWYQDVNYSDVLEQKMNSIHMRESWRPFTVYDVQAAFFLWIVGIVIAILTLIFEVLRKKCVIVISLR